MIIKRKSFARAQLLLSVSVALVSAPASAFVVLDSDAGQLRLDTTVRYNLGWRVRDPSPVFANNYGSDETETIFKKHDLITNRLDVLMESDYIGKYENGLNYGARVSGAAWDEMAYPGHSKTNPEIDAFFAGVNFPAPPSNQQPNGRWSNYTKRFTTGSSGELLDAFVFSGFDIGGTNLNVKLGKHTIAWGESMFNAGVNVYQSPVDAIKAVSVPGSQTKELFMPINQLSASWMLNKDWSLIGDYQLEWRPIRTAGAGTFFSAGDGAGSLWGADPACAGTAPGPTCIPSLDAVTPNRNGGSWGLGARLTPSWWDGTMGFYYRKYDELAPWAALQVTTGLPGIRLSYKRDAELYGASITHGFDPNVPIIGGVNFAVEAVYRKNTALSSIFFPAGIQGGVAPTVFANPGVTPSYGQMEGASGDAYTLNINGITLLDKTFWYEAGIFLFELNYQRLDKVTKNPDLFNSVDYACKNGNVFAGLAAGATNKGDGCATKDSMALSLSFSPQWLGAFPSVDLTMPTSLTTGIYGNSPINGGNSNYGAYSWSAGLTALYKNTYEFGAQISGSHQNYKTGIADGSTALPGTREVTTSNGPTPIQNGHTWFGVHFKTSF